MSYFVRLLAALVFLFGMETVYAHNGFELGAGAGLTSPFAGDSFQSNSNSGNANFYWLGFYLKNNLSLNLNYDSYDFDKADLTGQMISVGATYHILHENWIHPEAQIALGSATTKNTSSDKYSGLGGKAALGLVADFKYVSVGALLNWLYNDKVIGATSASSKIENAQAIVPMLTMTFHLPFEHEPVKAATPAQPAAAVTIKDADQDGVADADDVCPNTQLGIKVNSVGCSEKEKANIKLQIEFAAGKSEITEKYQSEILRLADFMQKFPETKVEIAGHTDNKGNAKKNRELSQSRAEAVKIALIKAGIASDRVKAVGYGASQPVANNDKPEGRAANRRVMAEVSIETEVKK